MTKSKISLHYHKLGNGPHTLLAFHGIGQDGKSCFDSFAENLGGYYTVYAFDLFFHGESNQTSITDSLDKVPVSKEFWKDIISYFLDKEDISRFDVAGFSMGGRFAMATLESFSNQIEKAFLIAPDGVSEHPVYAFASRVTPARYVFRWLMEHPEVFLNLASILKKTGLIHGSLHRFTQQVLNTPAKRLTVYNSWVTFRKLKFNISELIQKLENDRIDLYLFIGKYDKLLKPKAVKSLAKLLPPERYIVLQSGHGQLVDKVSEYCAKFLR
jgi:pimeloyl-ACP methyl ester carboxylesterase